MFNGNYVHDKIVTHQVCPERSRRDHLSGTSLVTSDNGISLGTMKYYPFGGTRAGDVPTDIKFTGQRLDDTGLYYFNARYYDATIGRFISADTIVPRPAYPQGFNRYSYCLNNPLKYIDPSGYKVEVNGWDIDVINAFLNSSITLPGELGLEIWEVINSSDYQAYLELKQDENSQIEEMENSDTVWDLFCRTESFEDDNDGNYNAIYLISEEGDVNRYRWNTDPAWWQDAEWQQDWVYNNAEGITRTLNVITVIGDCVSLCWFFPPAMVGGYLASTFSSFGSWMFTHYKYDVGLAAADDLVMSYTSFSMGVIPGIGTVPAIKLNAPQLQSHIRNIHPDLLEEKGLVR